LKRGYVRRDPLNSKFQLGFKLFELGQRIAESLNLREKALPILKEIADKTGECAFLSVVDNDEAFFLEKVDGYRAVKVLIVGAGGRLPLHMGGGGKILLAFLPEKEIERIIKIKGLPAWTKYTITDEQVLKEDFKKIRKQGYAVSIEEVAEDAGAIGFPVRNWKSEVVAAISLSGLVNHFRGEALTRYIEIGRSAAVKLSKSLNAPF
jgi:IclR family transcriptional regulator, KDG regulon repressor